MDYGKLLIEISAIAEETKKWYETFRKTNETNRSKEWASKGWSEFIAFEKRFEEYKKNRLTVLLSETQKSSLKVEESTFTEKSSSAKRFFDEKWPEISGKKDKDDRKLTELIEKIKQLESEKESCYWCRRKGKLLTHHLNELMKYNTLVKDALLTDCSPIKCK